MIEDISLEEPDYIECCRCLKLFDIANNVYYTHCDHCQICGCCGPCADPNCEEEHI